MKYADLYPLITSDELRDLDKRWRDFDTKPHRDDIPTRLDNASVQALHETARYLIIQGALLEDPSLLPIITNALRYQLLFDHLDNDELVYNVSQSITSMYAASPPPPLSPLADLARLPEPDYRLLAVKLLDPNQPKHQAWLRKLMEDHDNSVRNAARHRLSQTQNLPWWTGRFSRDPADILDDDDAFSAAQPLLQDALALLASPSFSLRDDQQLADLLRQLPPPLTIDLLTLLLRDFHTLQHAPHSHLTLLLISLDGGIDALSALISSWSATLPPEISFLQANALARFLKNAPTPNLHALCTLLLDLLAHDTTLDQPKKRNMGSLAYARAELISHIWPPDHDPTPLLNALDAITYPKTDLGTIYSELTYPLKHANPDLIPWPRLLALRHHNFPGIWAHLKSDWFTIMKRAPSSISGPLITDLLSAEDKHGVQWAMEYLSATLEDDEQLLRSFLDEPHTRKTLFSSNDLRKKFRAPLRALFLDGHCSFDEALGLMYWESYTHPRGSFFGTFYSLVLNWNDKPDKGPVDDSPPPPHQLDAWRRLRDHHTSRDVDFYTSALSILPSSPDAWTDSDRAFIHDALDFYRRHLPPQFYLLAAALAHLDFNHHIDTIDTLLGAGTPEIPYHIRQLRQGIEALFGPLPTPTPTDDDFDF